MLSEQIVIVSGGSNVALAAEVSQILGITLSQAEVSRFSNDNLFVQIMESVREREVFVIQSFTQPVSDHIVEMCLLLDALRGASARRITAVIPYYSYARSDKKDKPRISVAGRLMADLLVTAGANRVLTMDLHADQVQGFFSVPVDHLTAINVIAHYFKENYDLTNIVAVAADVGAAKRAGQFSRRLGIPLAFIDKRRISDTQIEQSIVVGDVQGRDVIVFEDEIATGSTLISTAKILQTAGVRKIYVGATHPVLCGNAIANLAASPIERIIVTNTAHVGPEKQIDKIHVLSVAPIFAEAIRRIHNGESMGALFRYD